MEVFKVPAKDKQNELLEEEAVACAQVFPFEIWKILLEYMHDKEKSPLWNFRLVCKDLNSLTNEVLKENSNLWNKSLKFEERTDWDNFLDERRPWVRGTRLSSVDKASRFIEVNDGVSNPFPNGTLILANPPGENEDLSVVLHKLVKTYQKKILTLVYSFNGNEEEELIQFLDIFKLVNLRSLVIYNENWADLSYSGLKMTQALSNLEEMGGGPLPVPNNLKEIQIFGKFPVSSVLYVFPLFKKVFQSLTHLGCSLNWRCFDKLPNEILSESLHEARSQFYSFQLTLSSLKISAKFWNHMGFCFNLLLKCPRQETSRLKELRLKYPLGTRCAKVKRVIELNFRALDALKIWLELEELEIQLYIGENFAVSDSEDEGMQEEVMHLDPQLNTEVKYSKLTHLIITISTVFHWPELIRKLALKFNNLKKLTLQMTIKDLEDATPQEFHDANLTKLWTTFPGLQVIRVPLFSWTLKRGRELNFKS